MPVRTNAQIQRELARTDAGQRRLINQQLAGLSGMYAGQEQGLRAQQTQAFGQILSGAKGRGLKFSGIPLEEQATYTSTQFLPALAGLRNQENQQRFGLQGALADIIAQRGQTAQGLRQTELDRAFQASENEKSRRASAAASAAQFNAGSIIEQLQKRIAELIKGSNVAPATPGSIGTENLVYDKASNKYLDMSTGQALVASQLGNGNNLYTVGY